MASIFEPVDIGNFTEAAAAVDPIAFENIVRSRRSVRVYTEELIPENIVDKCFDLALLAPNSSNLQTWAFYQVKSEAKRKAMNEACLSQPAATTAPVLIMCVVRLNIWRAHAKLMLSYFDKQKNRPPQAAIDYYTKLVPLANSLGPIGLFGLAKKIILPIIGVFKPVPRGPASYADLRVWAHKSAALACENLMLAFRAYGYDTCPMEGFDSQRVKSILGLGRHVEVVMAISAGKRGPKGVYGPQIRFDRSLFIHEV